MQRVDAQISHKNGLSLEVLWEFLQVLHKQELHTFINKTRHVFNFEKGTN